MNSRVHPTYKIKYRVANWASYDRALVGRGDITLWLSPEALATWEPVGVGTRGGQQKYSDVAIETTLTLRLLFHLPLRQAEGFAQSLFGMMGLQLSTPDHTTLSRRGQLLDVRLRRVPTGKGLHLIVDSTGLSIVGDGEWARAKHGRHGTRGWKKLHLGVDRSGVVVAHTLTDATVDDAATAIALISVVDGGLTSVTGDAASTRSPSTMPRGRVVRPSSCRQPRQHRYRSAGCGHARDRAIKRMKKIGRRRWKKEAG
jgi:IS5 family transposase